MSDQKTERKVREDFVRIKTRAELLETVPARWAEQYPPSRIPDDHPQGKIRAALLGLDIWGRNRERMDAIIGNTGWTEQLCGRCGVDSDVLLQIGEKPDYEARWVDLCPDCVRDIAAITPP